MDEAEIEKPTEWTPALIEIRPSAGKWTNLNFFRKVQRGVPLAMVQAILGHSSVQVTQKYAHHAPDALKKAMREALG